MTEVNVDIDFGRAIAVSVPTTTTFQHIASSPCWLVGWSLRETTGAAVAEVEFTSGGNPIGESSVASGGSDTHTFSGANIEVSSDITLTVISGSVRGSVYVKVPRF
jgi:hypothetical protein